MQAALPQAAAAQHWYDATSVFGSPHFNLISDNDRLTLRNYIVNEHERQCGQKRDRNA